MGRYRKQLERDPGDKFALSRLQRLYLERDGDLKAWLAELQGWIEREPESYAPRFVLAQTLHSLTRLAQAETLYAAAVRLSSTKAQVALAHAAVLVELERPAEARQVYERLLQGRPSAADRGTALRALGALEVRAGEIDSARAHFAQLKSLGGDGVYAAGEFGRALTEAGLHKEAAQAFLEAAKAMRGDARAAAPLLRDAGGAQVRAGNADVALKTLQRALSASRGRPGLRAEIYDLLIAAHRQTDSLRELAQQFERKLTGRDFELVSRLSQLWDELGDEDRAAQAYERALSLSPRHLDTRLRYAQLLSRSGRLEDVIAQYEQLVRLAPEEPSFVVHLAELLVQTGKPEQARKLVAREGKKRPRSVPLHRALAELYTRWQEPDLAARELELLLRIEPQEPAHRIALGSHKLERGERQAALRIWKGLLDAGGDRAESHAVLASVLADHDLLREALPEIDKALALRPGHLPYLRTQASLLERLGRTAQAESGWQQVMRSSLSQGDRVSGREARQHVVSLWKRTGILARRLRGLERQFRNHPEDLEAGRMLAEAYARMGDREQDAIRVLEQLAKAAPGDVETLRALERAYARSGELDRAQALLERLVEADPTRAQGYLRRAVERALSQYRDAEALRLAELAVRLSPRDAQAQRLLGDLYRGRQDLVRSAQAYGRALSLDPRQFETALALSEVELARGEVASADAALRSVMRASPDDDLVARATRSALQLHLGAQTLGELEAELLPLSLARPGRPVYRRLVVELYGAWVGPVAQRLQAGVASQQETELLQKVGRRAIKPLLEALADSDPTQRAVALDVLGHLDNPNAASPLLALVETSTDAAERARALLAAGALVTPALVPRFEVIARGNERRLRSLSTWALARAGGPRAISALKELLRDGDASVRAFAALGLGVHRVASAEKALVERALRERHSSVRGACWWAIGQIAPDRHRARLLEALQGSSPAAELALHTLRSDPRALARGLFLADSGLRKLAAALLVSPVPQRAAPRLPVPQWPLSLRAYLRTLASSYTTASRPVDLSRWVEPIAEAARAALAGSSERALTALQVLSSGRGRLGLPELNEPTWTWPAPYCGGARQAMAAVAAAIQPELTALASSSDAVLRSHAVILLVRTGHADAAAVVQVLRAGAGELRRAVLDGLAQSPDDPPEIARKPLLALIASDEPWSDRLRALRALGSGRSDGEIAVLARIAREDDYALLREAAVDGLRGSQRPAARQGLSAAAKDSEPSVARRATTALKGGKPSPRPSGPACPTATPN